MAVLTDKSLEEILDYLTKSLNNLARQAMESLEYQGDLQAFESFLSSQFDIRLQNLLEAKNSSIHHLESGKKNKVIQKKQQLLEDIRDQFKH